MRKICLILFFVFSFLFFSLPAFAEIGYSRTPSGTEIISPVSFDVSWTEYHGEVNTDTNFWKIGVKNSEMESFLAEDCLASTTLAHFFTISLPVGNYVEVDFFGGETIENCGEYEGNVVSDDIFSIIETPAGYFPTDFASSVFGLTSDFLFDLRVILYILVGLALGTGIILFIIDFFEDKKTK